MQKICKVQSARMAAMKVRIVLLPDKKLEEEAKDASNLVTSKVPTHFKLNKTHIPHVTITALEFENKYLEEIIKLVKRYSDYEQIKVKTNEVKISKKTFIGVYFQEDSLIKKLRAEVIQSLTKYNKKDIILKQSHITLTRVVAEKDALKALEFVKDFPKKDFYLISLAICEDGPNGTCSEIISQFTLRG